MTKVTMKKMMNLRCSETLQMKKRNNKCNSTMTTILSNKLRSFKQVRTCWSETLVCLISTPLTQSLTEIKSMEFPKKSYSSHKLSLWTGKGIQRTYLKKSLLDRQESSFKAHSNDCKPFKSTTKANPNLIRPLQERPGSTMKNLTRLQSLTEAEKSVALYLVLLAALEITITHLIVWSVCGRIQRMQTQSRSFPSQELSKLNTVWKTWNLFLTIRIKRNKVNLIVKKNKIKRKRSSLLSYFQESKGVGVTQQIMDNKHILSIRVWPAHKDSRTTTHLVYSNSNWRRNNKYYSSKHRKSQHQQRLHHSRHQKFRRQLSFPKEWCKRSHQAGVKESIDKSWQSADLESS